MTVRFPTRTPQPTRAGLASASCAAAIGALVAACGDTPLALVEAPSSDAGSDAGNLEGGSNEDRCAGNGFPPGACRAREDAAVTQQSRCVPGVYEGFTQGSYRSSAAGVGIIAPISDADHRTALRFNLRADDTEFYDITNGCVHVSDVVNGVTLEENAVYLFTGKVSCATGKLSGEIRGYYTALDITTLAVTKYYLKGTLSGTYDPATQSFVDTSFEAREPKVLLGEQPGGSGTWTAQLVPDAGTSESQANCFPEPFPEHLFE